MSESLYRSKERVERDGVLIYAEGDDLIDDPEELERQGYTRDAELEPKYATERIERDGVLIAAEGDVLPPDVDSLDEAEAPAKARASSKSK